ncbi:DedA family protein [bacterium]|nr:MAG: DedA family protein [bacterium]
MSPVVEPGKSERRPSVRWRILAGAALLAGVVVAMALLVEHDAAGQALETDVSIAALLKRHGYLAGFALIYIEESGIPLFIPGDAFLLYVGHHVPHHVPALAVAWLGMVLAVTLGATNLYLISRRFGRRLLDHRLATLLHLTPGRMDRAELWFRRWGPWALILGRHVPGLRVPLTVAAGVLQLRYRVFAISVAVSSAAWTAAFLALGAVFGASLERWIRSTPVLYGMLLVLVVLAVGAVAALRARRPAPGPRRN